MQQSDTQLKANLVHSRLLDLLPEATRMLCTEQLPDTKNVAYPSLCSQSSLPLRHTW
jgi:hypothetical protein